MNLVKSLQYLACIILLVMSLPVVADEVEQRRVHIGASLFPRIVAVDLDIKKKLDVNGAVGILVVYESSSYSAEDVVGAIRKQVKVVGKFPVSARAISLDDFLQLKPADYTAVFLAEKLQQKELSRLINQAGKQERLLFSPFVGHVEKGVIVGINVENRIRPYFNVGALKKSKIRMNQKLLGVSKRYE